MQLKDLKVKVWQQCCELIRQRMEVSRKAMQAAQESANSEEKSSAGDKYETARAMSQLDRDRAAKQLDQSTKELARLERIDPNSIHEKAGPGSLIGTGQERYFIAAAVGTIEVDGEKITVISPASPLAMQLQGCGLNEERVFNGKKMRILSIS
jgi:hypothetical protein